MHGYHKNGGRLSGRRHLTIRSPHVVQNPATVHSPERCTQAGKTARKAGDGGGGHRDGWTGGGGGHGEDVSGALAMVHFFFFFKDCFTL